MTLDPRAFLGTGAAGLLAARVARADPLAGWGPVTDTLDGLSPIARFPGQGGIWCVYERRDASGGTLWFVSPDRRMRALPVRLEACGARNGPFYGGLDFATVALSGPDLLADHLLASGDDPDEAAVRAIAPPVASRVDPSQIGPRLLWTFFLATRQGGDTMPVTPAGSTRNWHVDQAVPELTEALAMVEQRSEGLLGGWMPALVKRFPIDAIGSWEVMLFAVVGDDGPPLTPTAQPVCLIENGSVHHTRFFGSTRASARPRRCRRRRRSMRRCSGSCCPGPRIWLAARR